MVENSKIALPNPAHLGNSICLSNPFQSTLDKIDRAAGPIFQTTDAEPQKAHPERCCGLFIPTRAIPPSDAFDLWDGNRYRQAD